MTKPQITIFSGPLHQFDGPNRAELGLFAMSGFKIPFLPEPLTLDSFVNQIEGDYAHHLDQQIRFLRMFYPQPEDSSGFQLWDKTAIELRFVSRETEAASSSGRRIDMYVIARTAYGINQDTADLRSDIEEEALSLHYHVERSFPLEYTLRPLTQKDWAEASPLNLQKIKIKHTAEIRKFTDQDFAFQFNWTLNTLAQLCKALTQIKNNIVLSISLHPTQPLEDEVAYLRKWSAEKIPLDFGMFTDGIGVSKDYMHDVAEKKFSARARTAGYYLRTWHRPFLLRIQILSEVNIPMGFLQTVGEEFSPTEDSGNLDLAVGPRQTYQIIYPESSSELEDAIYNYRTVSRKFWGQFQNGFASERLNYMVGSTEANSAFRIPLVGPYGLPGVETIPFNPFAIHKVLEKTSENDVIELGNDVHGAKFNIPVSSLSRHALIVGATGSGKTTTCQKILIELQNKGIPFLVIEPVKSEYRKLLCRPEFFQHPEKRILVFTIGDVISPFSFNPFEIPSGISVGSYISAIKSCFVAAFPMETFLPIVLEKALRQVYKDFGWSKLNERVSGTRLDRFPRLSDLCDLLTNSKFVESLGYSEDLTLDVQAALTLRLSNLRDGIVGAVLDVKETSPFSWEDLLKRPVIFEMESIVDDEEKALIMSLVFTILSFRRKIIHQKRNQSSLPESLQSNLDHVTLIEEAHRLFSNTGSQNSQESVSSQAKSIGLFTNMLAEMRALGEGILIAEQIPTRLVSEIIKYPELKIMHRITAEEDRRILGESMSFSSGHQKFVVTLRQGMAAIYWEGLYTPSLVYINRIPHKLQEVSEDMLGQYMKKNTPNSTRN